MNVVTRIMKVSIGLQNIVNLAILPKVCVPFNGALFDTSYRQQARGMMVAHDNGQSHCNGM